MGRAIRFILLLAAFLLAADRLAGAAAALLHARQRSGDAGGRVNRVLAAPDAPDLAVLGSSRAAHEMDPEALGPGAVNLGHDGHYLLFSAGVVSLLAEAGRLPPVVVLHLDQKVFFEHKDADYDAADLRLLRPYHGRIPWLEARIDSLPLAQRCKFLSSAYRYNGILPAVIRGALRPGSGRADGFLPLEPGPGDSLRVLGRPKPTLSGRYGPGILDLRPMGLLHRIVETCRSRGSTLVCYTGPLYHREAARAFAPVHRLLDSALARENIPYFDYREHPPEALLDISLWKDHAHLNYRGAGILSRDLAGRIDSLRPPDGRRNRLDSSTTEG